MTRTVSAPGRGRSTNSLIEATIMPAPSVAITNGTSRYSPHTRRTVTAQPSASQLHGG